MSRSALGRSGRGCTLTPRRWVLIAVVVAGWLAVWVPLDVLYGGSRRFATISLDVSGAVVVISLLYVAYRRNGR